MTKAKQIAGFEAIILEPYPYKGALTATIVMENALFQTFQDMFMPTLGNKMFCYYKTVLIYE